MARKRLPLLMLLAALAVLAGSMYAARGQVDPTVENVRAFAKLYGYVRYFHPSDEASAIGWGRFSVHGVRQVKHATSTAELHQALEALFLPIAPTLQIYPAGQAPPAPSPYLIPSDTAGLDLVVWQHRDFDLGFPGFYRSIRLNRPVEVSAGPGFGSIGRRIDAYAFRGKEIRLEAAVKTRVSGDGNQAQLWLRVDRPDRQMGFLDTMERRPVTAAGWDTYTITGPVAEDAVHISFGGMLVGDGEAWLDHFQLFFRDAGQELWTPARLENAGFEANELAGSLAPWATGSPGYKFEVSAAEAFDGERSLAITSPDAVQMARPLFEERPMPGEVLQKPIGAGLWVQLPLALYSRDGHTLGRDEEHGFEGLAQALGSFTMNELTPSDEDARLAGVVVAWNVLQHFYPYFDVVETDWDAVLTTSLRDARQPTDARGHLRTLRKMMAQLQDGHGAVNHAVEQRDAGLPLVVDWVEDLVVVVATADSSLFQIGDIVVSVDGSPSLRVLQEAERYVSGSPQLKRRRALQQFARGEQGTLVTLQLLRGEDQIEVTLPRTFNGELREHRPGNVEEIEEGIFYVNLDEAEMPDINARSGELASAKGIVFDLRGYPNGNHQVLAHLTDRPLLSAIAQVPHLIYPDQEDLVGYDTTGRWYLEPHQPRFGGTIVFLTDKRAISYAESVMGIVEHYRLGEIVGQPTAGANGNVNPFTVPGGYRITYTGMRLLKHDGSQHHLVGIQPTIPVERTLEGIRAGRDEYLERAIEVIRSREGG